MMGPTSFREKSVKNQKTRPRKNPEKPTKEVLNRVLQKAEFCLTYFAVKH
jgi:hypothetical protein